MKLINWFMEVIGVNAIVEAELEIETLKKESLFLQQWEG